MDPTVSNKRGLLRVLLNLGGSARPQHLACLFGSGDPEDLRPVINELREADILVTDTREQENLEKIKGRRLSWQETSVMVQRKRR